MVFSGEEFAAPGTARRLKEQGHILDVQGSEYIVHLYEEDPSFPAGLNGRFHGLLADRTRRTAMLFNDRLRDAPRLLSPVEGRLLFRGGGEGDSGSASRAQSDRPAGIGRARLMRVRAGKSDLVRRDLRTPRRGQVGPA